MGIKVSYYGLDCRYVFINLLTHITPLLAVQQGRSQRKKNKEKIACSSLWTHPRPGAHIILLQQMSAKIINQTSNSIIDSFNTEYECSYYLKRFNFKIQLKIPFSHQNVPSKKLTRIQTQIVFILENWKGCSCYQKDSCGFFLLQKKSCKLLQELI